MPCSLLGIGGRGGIRTPGSLATTSDFESGALNHSATLPVVLAMVLRSHPTLLRTPSSHGQANSRLMPRLCLVTPTWDRGHLWSSPSISKPLGPVVIGCSRSLIPTLKGRLRSGPRSLRSLARPPADRQTGCPPPAAYASERQEPRHADILPTCRKAGLAVFSRLRT